MSVVDDRGVELLEPPVGRMLTFFATVKLFSGHAGAGDMFQESGGIRRGVSSACRG